ncbi:amino acid transporter [Nemania sp. FL0916]|nr:amino acid transporter [Nemania sp. FL0916]
MSKDAIELRTNALSVESAEQGAHSQRYNDDEATLRRLGKRPRLTRTFGFMSVLGFSCSSLCSWESVLLTSVPGLLIGGPAGLTWALVLNWIGITSIYAVLGELASIAPTSGGQYHWVAMLAPQLWSNFLCYMTAWLTTLAWQAASATVSYLIATLLQGIIVLAPSSTYVPANWHTVLLMWAFSLFAALLNSINSRALAKLEGLILILHLAGFLGVLVPLVYFSPKNDPSFVFLTFINEGAWQTQALAFFVAFPTVATALIGADCAVHMSEEIQHAALIVPQALMYTIFINGALTFAMVIALLFCIQDLEAALAAVETVFYPCLQIFQAATQSAVGACLLGGVVFVLSVAASIGISAAASRMIWSFARDGGLPASRYLVKLTSNSLPTNAICTTLLMTVLLSLIVLGSSIALQALLSLLVAALFSSYILPCSLLLWRRLKGGLKPYLPGHEASDGSLCWGPWKVPEPFGTLNNIFACVYGTLTLFWSFWPQTSLPTEETANWSVLVFSVVVLFSVVWYIVRARKYFQGPIKEV